MIASWPQLGYKLRAGGIGSGNVGKYRSQETITKLEQRNRHNQCPFQCLMLHKLRDPSNRNGKKNMKETKIDHFQLLPLGQFLIDSGLDAEKGIHRWPHCLDYTIENGR